MPTDDQRLIDVVLDEATLVRRSPEVEHERAVAIFDLVEENDFGLVDGAGGPYRLRLGIHDGRLRFDVRDRDDAPLVAVQLSLTPFRSIIRDYFTVCESYYEAIRTASPVQIEAIDVGRRGLHNDGSERLRAQLAGKIDVDFDTARRLFTLICALHIRA